MKANQYDTARKWMDIGQLVGEFSSRTDVLAKEWDQLLESARLAVGMAGQADAWFKQRITDTNKAIEHRLQPWQPSDPERFALGLKLAREGKTISADEVRIRRLEVANCDLQFGR